MSTQLDKIVDFCSRGYNINGMIALKIAGCWRLSERIRELEEMGAKFHRERNDGPKKYMNYWMTKPPRKSAKSRRVA